ncbi:hypothetical protein BLS_007809 [Venturia inaequalis]|uniref:Uncharacterized protein n=1 Tax=Venturia inaequalis TaxID=5025 RepID=A0A8H3U973_VENIN|nr:hypothetical protein BLS_007809 [Venturia inaequalis]
MSSTQQYPPLTTVFTPPSQCSTIQITALEDNFLWQDLGLVFDFYNKSKKQDDAEFYCYPSGNYQNQLAFSPGIPCPHGYTEFTTLPIATSVSDHHDELTKFCCPNGFVGILADGYTYIDCVSKIAPPVIVWTQASSAASSTAWVVISLTSGLTLDLSDLYHPAITLRYKSSDLPSSSTTQAKTTAAESSLATRTTKIGPVKPQTSSATDLGGSTLSALGNGTDLSKGVRAGLIVGCVLALLIVIGVLIFCSRRRRQKRKICELDDNCVRAEMTGDAHAELRASKLYPSHELQGSDGMVLAGAATVALKSYASTEAERRNREPEAQMIYGVKGARGIEQEHDEEPLSPATTSGIRPNTLAARELQWLEQEENRIREQKARILAHHASS